MITRESLRVAHETCQFIATTDRQYDDSFAKTGAKIGSALRVRKPNQYVRTQGSRVMDVQDQAEASGTITVATQDHVDMRFNSSELALTIDEFSKRYIEPAVKTLVSGIESDYIAAATKATYNLVGTAGTAINSLTPMLSARARLNQGLAPKDGQRYVQMDSVAMGTFIAGVGSYMNPPADISKQYREGMVSRNAMADWYENDRMWSFTHSDDVTATTNASAAVTDGGNTIEVYTALPAAKQTVGTVFTIAGVYACHPQTKASLGYLQQFTVVTAATGSNATTISPYIYLTGAKKNVCSSSGADLATTDFNSKTMTFWGSASTTYPQQLMYHKEAFQIVFADLPLMASSEKCVRRVQDGISLRVWQDSDIRNDELLMRIDALYGFAALRPEWACRVGGAASA